MLCQRGPVTSLAIDTQVSGPVRCPVYKTCSSLQSAPSLRQGHVMATGGMDGEVKLWDLRTYKQLHFYQFTTPPVSLDISQRGLLAVGFGCHTLVWKDALATKVRREADEWTRGHQAKGAPLPGCPVRVRVRLQARSPYLRHSLSGSAVSTVRFRPFEDLLGLGHRTGFMSMGESIIGRA